MLFLYGLNSESYYYKCRGCGLFSNDEKSSDESLLLLTLNVGRALEEFVRMNPATFRLCFKSACIQIIIKWHTPIITQFCIAEPRVFGFLLNLAWLKTKIFVSQSTQLLRYESSEPGTSKGMLRVNKFNFKYDVGTLSIITKQTKPMYQPSIAKSKTNQDNGKKSYLTMRVSQKLSTRQSSTISGNRQLIEIFQSCRVFQNNTTHCNKYLSMSSVKKGKIPVKGHSLILSIDSTSSHKQNKGSKSGWRLNKPCPLSANLPVRPIYINLKHYCKNYGIKGYKLCQGDILKIGNKRVRVFSLNPTISVGGHPTNQTQITDWPEKHKSFHLQNMSVEGACRICLNDQTQLGDFMITPCQCRGSCATVHFQCLKIWVSSKVKIQGHRLDQKIKQFSLKSLRCEICKTQLPLGIWTEETDSPFYLFNINSGQLPSIILEVENQQRLSQISLKNQEVVQIGRALTSDLIFWDQNVSKIHCQIYCKNGEYFIQDLNSESGTFLLMNSSIEIMKYIQVEVGKSLYSIEVKDESKKDAMLLDQRFDEA